MKLTHFESKQIYHDNLVWLIAAQAASIVPLLRFLPTWITLIWLVSLLWRLMIFRGKLNYPGSLLKFSFAIALVVGIYISYAGQISAEPMVAFLVCSFVMKIIEMRTRKDALIVLFIAFIAIATQFLFAQDLLAGMYGFISLFVLISAWASLFCNTKITVFQHLKVGGRMILYASPMMLVMFVVMPRLGPLWAVPLPTAEGRTGFGESIQLGDIGNLVRSPEVAFRARFLVGQPASRELYWRGLVLDYFDGFRWSSRQLKSQRVENVNAAKVDGDTTVDLNYSVVIEPHHYQWLFTLGFPLQANSSQLSLSINKDGLLAAKKSVTQKSEYHVKASKYPPMMPISQQQLRDNLHLPDGYNPRARALAKRLVEDGSSGFQVVNKALKIFSNDFSYTLRTDEVRINAIDYFLFESRKGFCEHFASSFVFLMRNAGVPARIVIGYQGGDLNRVDNYFIVRQSDAHAWAEVWLEGQGWTRIDPTSMVAPERIESGVDQALMPEDRVLLASSWQNKMFRKLAHQWDSMGYSWNRWVLNFDTNKQKGLLSSIIGSADPWRVGLVIGLLAALILLPIFIVQYLRARPRFELHENRLVRPLMFALAATGYSKLPNESFPSYLRRVASEYPKIAQSLTQIARLYEQYSYRGCDNQVELRRQVRACCRQIKSII